MRDEALGRAAYQAYCKAVGNKSVRGEELPQWEQQAEHIKDAWCEAAVAAIQKFNNDG
jgi:hypothetical protein